MKWQIALKPVQPIRFYEPFKAILAGTCIASSHSKQVGEYLAECYMLIVATNYFYCSHYSLQYVADAGYLIAGVWE